MAVTRLVLVCPEVHFAVRSSAAQTIRPETGDVEVFAFGKVVAVVVHVLRSWCLSLPEALN